MTEETFNLSLRKFLKTVGVTSQQEIEKAVRQAKSDGRLGDGPLQAKVVLSIDAIGLEHEVSGDISLSEAE